MKLSEHRDFQQAVVQAAEHFSGRGLRPALVEKDYYVTEALRIIATRAGPERVRGLQRMAPLDAPPARHTRLDVDPELADDRLDHRQIFLERRPDVSAAHRAAAGGTGGRQRGGRPLTLPVRLGERRGLPEAGAPRRVQLVLQVFVPTLQAIALSLDARQRLTQPHDLRPLPFDQRLAQVRRWRRRYIMHTLVMPDGRPAYKYKILDRRRSGAQTR